MGLTDSTARQVLLGRGGRNVTVEAGDDNSLFQGGPANGEPMANVRLGQDHYLMDHFPAGFLLLVFGELQAMAPQVLAAVQQAKAGGLPLALVGVTAASDAQAPEGVDQMLCDPDQHLAQTYGVAREGAAYLFRPDQHVCARWLTISAQRLSSALNQAMGLS